jgi:spermidine synthase
VNTFGAVAGTVVASFALLPGLGLSATLATGVALNVAVGTAALALARRRGGGPSTAHGAEGFPEGTAPVPRPVLAACAAFLGFSALALEVLWTRTLALALGTTTYAFAIVLSVFLLGIAGGSALAGPLLARGRVPARMFLAAPAAIGFLALALVPLFERLPDLFVQITARGEGTWGQTLLAMILLAGIPLLPPTLVSGAAFPLAVGLDRSFASHRSAGDLYAVNTLGAILGSWAAGFALLPLLGLQGGIEAVAALLVAVSGAALLAYRTRRRALVRSVSAALLVAAAAVIVALPEWDLALLTRGGFVLGRDLQRSGTTELGRDAAEIVFLEEGVTSTVTVRREDGEYTMQMNGVTEASTSGDLSTQVGVATLPLVLHEGPRDVLVIGLGGGVTAGAVARFPGVESIECVEISEAVVRAAAYFDDANHGVLRDPRFRLVTGDGRNHLLLADRSYDAIVSLPSHAWNAGIGSLMSAEFYALCRERLSAGGIACTWIQGYSVSADVLKSVLAAAGRSFARVSLWRGAWGDLLIVAGGEDLAFDAGRLLSKERDPAIGTLLREADVPDLLSFLSLNLLAGERLREYVGGIPANTDDRPVLEFETPKLLYTETMPALFTSLHAGSAGTEEYLTNAPEGLAAQLPRVRRARSLESEARLALRDREGEKALAALEEARDLLPNAPSIRRTLAGLWNARAVNFANTGKTAEAGRALARAIEVDPGLADSYGNLAELYLAGGDLVRAREAAAEAVARNPRKPDYRVVHAKILTRTRELEEARAELRSALELDPRNLEGHAALVEVLYKLGEEARADSVLAAGLALHPGAEVLTKLERMRSGRSE